MKHILQARSLPVLTIPVIAGVVLTLLAPLGTQVFPPVFRTAYWVGLCYAGALGAFSVQIALAHWMPTLSGWRYILLQSVGSTFAVVPFVIAISGQTTLISVGTTIFYGWLIAVVITTFAELAGQSGDAETDIETTVPAIMSRLPAHMRDATLYAVSSEDHYVRVYTSEGQHMMLMRLADVEDLAKPLIGLSPHRSWWVAEGGVARIERHQGKRVLILKDGMPVPVSRTGVRALRDAGWLN